jgi:hypothetical protein
MLIVVGGVFAEATVTVPLTGAIPVVHAAPPAPAVATCPGVIVIVHEAFAANVVPQVVLATVVPAGKPELVMATLIAGKEPELVMVITRDVPVKLAFEYTQLPPAVGHFTERANVEMLLDKVVIANVTCTV